MMIGENRLEAVTDSISKVIFESSAFFGVLGEIDSHAPHHDLAFADEMLGTIMEDCYFSLPLQPVADDVSTNGIGTEQQMFYPGANKAKQIGSRTKDIGKIMKRHWKIMEK